MVTPGDVYMSFIRQKEIYHNKKLNPNISRLSKENFDKLQKMADYFSTIYQNIDMDVYIATGFELWKTFNISKIDDKRIFEKYKSNDKRKKRNFSNISTEEIEKSITYIHSNYGNLFEYCKNDVIIRRPINDYIHNKIDGLTLIFLVEKKYIRSFNEEEKPLISYIISNYTDMKHRMYKYYEYLLKNL